MVVVVAGWLASFLGIVLVTTMAQSIIVVENYG